MNIVITVITGGHLVIITANACLTPVFMTTLTSSLDTLVQENLWTWKEKQSLIRGETHGKDISCWMLQKPDYMKKTMRTDRKAPL